jgi:hypothetical protein
VNGHRIIDTPSYALRRLILAALCVLAVLLLPNLAKADSLHTRDPIVRFVVTDVDRDGDPDLVASRRGSVLHVWINKGRGLFVSPSGRRQSPHGRLALHPPKPGVREVQAVRLDDSELNDSSRLLITWSASARARLIPVGETSTLAEAAFFDVTYRRRPPRGPPTPPVS